MDHVHSLSNGTGKGVGGAWARILSRWLFCASHSPGPTYYVRICTGVVLRRGRVCMYLTYLDSPLNYAHLLMKAINTLPSRRYARHSSPSDKSQLSRGPWLNSMPAIVYTYVDAGLGSSWGLASILSARRLEKSQEKLDGVSSLLLLCTTDSKGTGYTPHCRWVGSFPSTPETKRF